MWNNVIPPAVQISAVHKIIPRCSTITRWAVCYNVMHIDLFSWCNIHCEGDLVHWSFYYNVDVYQTSSSFRHFEIKESHISGRPTSDPQHPFWGTFCPSYLQQEAPAVSWDGRISAENAVSDGGGLTRPWLWRSSDPNLVMKFGANKLEWMGYIPAKFRDSSSRISWFAHRRFLPPTPTHPPGGNHSAIYPLMRPKIKYKHFLLSS